MPNGSEEMAVAQDVRLDHAAGAVPDRPRRARRAGCRLEQVWKANWPTSFTILVRGCDLPAVRFQAEDIATRYFPVPQDRSLMASRNELPLFGGN